MIYRGEVAAILLGDSTLRSFFEELKADILASIGNTDPAQEDHRRDLYFQHRGINEVIAHMSTYVEMAAAAREEDEKEQEDYKSPNEPVGILFDEDGPYEAI